MKTARDILNDKKPSPERDNLEKTADEIERRWHDVFDKVIKRHKQIQRIMPQAFVYSSEVDHIEPWLDEAEKEIKSLPVLTGNPDDNIQHKRDLQVCLLCITAF